MTKPKLQSLLLRTADRRQRSAFEKVSAAPRSCPKKLPKKATPKSSLGGVGGGAAARKMRSKRSFKPKSGTVMALRRDRAPSARSFDRRPLRKTTATGTGTAAKSRKIRPKSSSVSRKRSIRRTKLIDAGPGSRKIGGRGTPVLFLAKDSIAGHSTRKRAGAVKSGASHKRSHRKVLNYSRHRIDQRFMTMPMARAHEGVDFFYHLGQRVNQPPVVGPFPASRQMRLQGGYVGGMPGRLGGGVGGGVMGGVGGYGVNLSSGGAGGVGGGVNAGNYGGGATGLVMSNGGHGLAAIAGGVATSGVGLSAKNVEVPLTNRLPIIDFISTNEFHNMYAPRKQRPRPFAR
ncbi:hypothetical protein KR067_001676 [Drosophila pandora]|nr:hypothetical protein KR067_001676 [Drosophila pandora]